MIRGIIFDIDGTLADTEPATAKASVEGLREFGIYAAPEDFKMYVGTGEESYFGNVVRKYGGTYVPEMAKRIYEIYNRDIERDIVHFDGVVDVIRTLHRHGYRMALASASVAVKRNANIRAACLPLECFTAVVGAEHVARQKPDPEIFLTTAAQLGLSPSECIVAEDAVSGIRAAKAGGMLCLGITSTFDAEQLTAMGADWTGEHIRVLLELLNLPKLSG